MPDRSGKSSRVSPPRSRIQPRQLRGDEAPPEEPFDYAGEFTRLMIIVDAAATLSIDIDGLEEWLEKTHVLAPIMDPTAYMRGMRNLEEQAEVLRVAGPFIRRCRELKAAAKEKRRGG